MFTVTKGHNSLAETNLDIQNLVNWYVNELYICISYMKQIIIYDILPRLFYSSISLKEESTKLCFLFDFSWLVLLHGEF